MREQIKALEYHAYFLADFVDISLTVQRNTVDNNAAAGRLLQKVDAAQQSTLTTTAGADDNNNLFFRNSQVYTLEYVQITKAFLQIFDYNHFLAHFVSNLRSR